MMKLTHRFVASVPDELEAGVVYVSIEFATAIHKCCCGCGKEVVTPLSPNDWRLIFDGRSISLYPSIGNWSFECQSHYWIRNNAVEWAAKLTKEEIQEVREEREKLAEPSSTEGKIESWHLRFFGGDRGGKR